MDYNQEIKQIEGIPANLETLEVSGNSIAWSLKNDTSGPTVYSSFLTGTTSETSVNLDVVAKEDQDQFLIDESGIDIDYSNASVVEISVDGQSIVAVVDIGPIKRTVFVDTVSGMQTLISNPLWESSSPSIGHGHVAFLQIPRYQPGSTIPEQSRLLRYSSTNWIQTKLDSLPLMIKRATLAHKSPLEELAGLYPE